MNVDSAATLRRRILAIGVGKVATAARLPRTTLYSFCQDPKRQLTLKTAVIVSLALDYLQGASWESTMGKTPEQPTFATVPLFNQSDGFAAQFSKEAHPRDSAAVGTLQFEVGWLKALGARDETWFAALMVTGKEMANVLSPGDHALIDLAAKGGLSGDGVYLLRYDDRLLFCEIKWRAKGPDVRFINQPDPLIGPLQSRKRVVMGKAVWVGKTLT